MFVTCSHTNKVSYKVYRHVYSQPQYRWCVCFWPVEFASGRLGASHLYGDSESGLEDGAERITCPCHLRDSLGPSNSSARFFTGQKLTTFTKFRTHNPNGLLASVRKQEGKQNFHTGVKLVFYTSLFTLNTAACIFKIQYHTVFQDL